MYISLKDPAAEIKTQRSEMSNIDMFSKLQSSFLQKYFKYNLNDYFNGHLTNVYEDIFDKKLRNEANRTDQFGGSTKLEKHMAASLYCVEKKATVEQMERSIQTFYQERSKSIARNQLPYAFKLKYSNLRTVPNLIKQGELIYIDVKIKAEVQKIQELPQKIIKYFDSYRLKKNGKLSNLQKLLSQYRKQYFNMFIVYFGDSNFEIYNKQNYQTKTIKIMGNFYKLRIFVFYVSRQALIETFKSVNKIQNIQYINDLVIQFYQLKREKQRRKRNKSAANRYAIQGKGNNDSGDGQSQNYKEKLYMFIGVFGLVGFGFALKKLLL